MDYQYYERKINDVITKCPIEAGVEILAYNVFDSILSPKEVTVVDINRVRKDRDKRVTTYGGVPDIIIVSNDFVFAKEDKGSVYGIVEVKATNILCKETKQIKGQKGKAKHYFHTNGLVWVYYENGKCTKEFVLTKEKVKKVTKSQKVTIDENEFVKLINEIREISWMNR